MRNHFFICSQPQYAFLYEVLSEALICGNTSISCSNFSTELRLYKQVSLNILYGNCNQNPRRDIHSETKIDRIVLPKISFFKYRENFTAGIIALCSGHNPHNIHRLSALESSDIITVVAHQDTRFQRDLRFVVHQLNLNHVGKFFRCQTVDRLDSSSSMTT